MLDRYPGRDLGADAIPDELPTDSSQLRTIRAPTLLISGEHDLQNRRDAATRLATALPAQLRLVSEAGHLPNLDNPQAYNEALTGFLERHVT